MNIKELREKIDDLPDDMEVCAIGHFGEAVRASAASFHVRKGPNELVDYGWEHQKTPTKDAVFAIPSVDIGPEPD